MSSKTIISLCFILSLFVKVFTEQFEDLNKNKNYTVCAYFRGNISHGTEDKAYEVLPAEAIVKCRLYCYTVWQEGQNNETVLLDQGCWQTQSIECEKSECITNKKPSKKLNQTKFCCCSSDYCNANFTNGYIEDSITVAPSDANSQEKSSVNPIIYIVIAVVFIVFIIVLTTILYLCWRMKPKKNDIESQHPVLPPEEFNLDKLRLWAMLGEGRYGSVWHGVVEDQDVAVKIFAAHHRNNFLHELDMYKAAGENSWLLKCFGGGEYTLTPGGLHYVLLLGLEKECLQDFLKTHTLDLATLSKMSLGIVKGLAHLHSDLGKPCVAHRDVNTRNILVRKDLSCCIADLGLAVIPKRAGNKAISEAGTFRYMAPEVLEGAVNLRDCESALKQIDVYSLGLVLWELGTRCSDMQNAEPQSYAPPYHKEAGDSPTLEQMQTLVSRRKARPLWPISWKDTWAARLLLDTAEECWDQDAEARLTALCVVERLSELPNLKGRALHPLHPSASPTSLINNNHLHDHQIDTTVGTIETLLSPSEGNYKNSNELAACKTPLQPYQGRNPCMERNLLSGSSNSLLIDKSSKHCNSSESQSLIPNEFLTFHLNHRATPIPYLQNAVHGFPKQHNTVNEPQPTPVKSKFKWQRFRNLFSSKKNSSKVCKDTQVKLNSKVVNHFGQSDVTISLLANENQNEAQRPSTLPLKVVTPQEALKSCGVSQIVKQKNSLSRQRSLEQFNEVFSSISDLSRLKDPSQRVKTPGDVPPSVRRTRGRAATDSARFSLYDDRMMSRGQWGSAPDLEPLPVPLKAQPTKDLQDNGSVSSF